MPAYSYLYVDVDVQYPFKQTYSMYPKKLVQHLEKFTAETVNFEWRSSEEIRMAFSASPHYLFA